MLLRYSDSPSTYNSWINIWFHYTTMISYFWCPYIGDITETVCANISWSIVSPQLALQLSLEYLIAPFSHYNSLSSIWLCLAHTKLMYLLYHKCSNITILLPPNAWDPGSMYWYNWGISCLVTGSNLLIKPSLARSRSPCFPSSNPTLIGKLEVSYSSSWRYCYYHCEFNLQPSGQILYLYWSTCLLPLLILLPLRTLVDIVTKFTTTKEIDL